MSLCHLNMQINLRMHFLCNLGLFKRIDLVFSLIVGHLGKSSSNRCEGLLWLWFSRIDSIKSPEGQCFYALLLILRSGSPTDLYVGFNGVCQCDNHDRLTPLPSYIFISRGIPSKLFTIKIIWNHIQVQSAGTWPSSEFGWIEKVDRAHV